MSDGAALHGWAENKSVPVQDRLQAALKVIEDVDYLLLRMAEEVNEVNVANGWFESERSFGDDIALLHSEVSEMFEAYRDSGLLGTTVCKSCGEANAGTLDTHCGTLMKPEGVGSEAADVLIRLLDSCLRADINLGQEFTRKLAYNRTRGHRHGGKLL